MAEPLEILISAFRERDLVFERNELEASFSSATDAAQNAATWVVETLHPDTLLTKDELAQYVVDRADSSLV